MTQKNIFAIYPLFQKYSRLKLKVAKKHFLQNQERGLNPEDTDNDRDFIDLSIKYKNFRIKSDKDRNKASKFFEKIICSDLSLHNQMIFFIRELKLSNDNKLNDLHMQKRNLEQLIKIKKQNQVQIAEYEKQMLELQEQIEDEQISVEILWREIIQLYMKHPAYERNKKILDAYRKCINQGFSFEIIDGENFYFPKQFLVDTFNHEDFKNKKLCVVSIIGPQNSGKSTLLNYLLGCDFTVSDGRCTRGIYGTIIKSNVPEFDLILVIDSEGLQSLEKKDPEYDRKIALFCLTISHFVIINVKDQLTNDILQLLEVCISAKQNIEADTIQKPIIEIVLNQKADPNQHNSEQAIDNVLSSFKQNKLDTEIDVSKENVTALPSAVTCEVVSISIENQQEWRYLKTQVDFVKRVKELGFSIINKLQINLRNDKNSVNYQLNFKNIIENMNQWIELASFIYDTISLHPSLTAFKSIRQKKVDSQLKEIIKKMIDFHFNEKLFESIELEIQTLKIKIAECVEKHCSEKREIIFKNFEIQCKTIQYGIDEIIERNKNYIESQITSYKIRYINELKTKINNQNIYQTLNKSLHDFDQIIKNLKNQNASEEQACLEFDNLFQKDLDNIQNDVPTNSQIQDCAFKFVNQQYWRYCSHDLKISGDEMIRRVNTPEQLEEKLRQLIQDKEVFYEQNNQFQIKDYIFTNDKFENFLQKFDKSIINIENIKKCYDNSKKLIDIAFKKPQSLKYFVNEKSENQKNQNDLNKHSNIQISINSKKVENYNEKLNILNISITPSYIESEIENNKAQLEDNNEIELIIEGKEEYINILNINIQENITNLKNQFNENKNIFKKIKLKDKTMSKKEEKILQIQYWKPFIQWVRKQFKNNMNKQNIIDINKFVQKIQENLNQKIQGKKVNEELIQTICGYINEEIKQQEDLVEMFKIKFSMNFKSYIHSIALISLFLQEKNLRVELLYKPIEDFKIKKNDTKQCFLAKFKTSHNINESSALVFLEFLKDHIYNQVQKNMEQGLNQIIQENENTLSRFELQKQVEESLTNFNKTQAQEYINFPSNIIQNILNKNLEDNIKDLQRIQQRQISDYINSIDKIKENLFKLNQSIKQQLQNQNYEIQESSQILQMILQIQNQPIVIKIQNFLQSQEEENKSKAFSHYIFNTLNGINKIIEIQNKQYNVQFNQSSQFKLESQETQIINELLKNGLLDQIQINSLTEFIQNLSKYENEIKDKINNINFIESIKARKNISDQHENILKSCQAKCPCCNQSCDFDHWKFKGVAIGDEQNKHQCNSGHRFVAFKGVKIEALDQPALNLCDDYVDDDIIIYRNQKISWKEFKEINSSWDWTFVKTNDTLIQKAKWSYLWKLVGKEICESFGIKNYIETMSPEQIEYYKNQLKSMHFIFVFDESSSMNGVRFKGLQDSLIQFIKLRINQTQNRHTNDICSLIGFSNNANIYANHEELAPQILNKIPKINMGGYTSFDTAFYAFIQNVLCSNKKFDGNIIVVFLSDGEGIFPQQFIDQLNFNFKGVIKQFLTIGYGNGDFKILKQIAEALQENCGGTFTHTLNSQQLQQEFEKFAYIIPN